MDISELRRLGLMTDDPVRDAVETLLRIGTLGLHDSNRADVWALALRALRALDGEPMTDDEVAAFHDRIPARIGGGRAHAAGSNIRHIAPKEGQP